MQDENFHYHALSHGDGPDMTSSLSARTVLLLSKPSVQAQQHSADRDKAYSYTELPNVDASVRIFTLNLPVDSMEHYVVPETTTLPPIVYTLALTEGSSCPD